eukprot:s3751_g4.t1
MTYEKRWDEGEERADENVPVALRSGAARFRFWRDLKPPFQVVQVTRSSDALGKWRDVDAEATRPHPDGELFYVTYECALAHHVERAWGLKTEAGTFDNRVHGVATVRIPLDYPDKSRCIITSWGNPVVNWNPNDDKDPIVETPTAIDPMMWMPIADELQQRPSIKKFAACRQETRIASRRADEKRKRGIEVPEMTRILLSSNPSLPRLAAAEQRCVDEGKAGGIFPPSPYFRLVMEKGEEKWGDNWWEVAAPRNGSCESIVSLRHPPALSTMLDEVGEAEVEQFLGHSGVKSAWLPHWSIGHGGFSRAELPPDLRG